MLFFPPSTSYTSCFRFAALSSSPLLLLLLFSSASLSGFHLGCTAQSLGATPLWPAGLPQAIIAAYKNLGEIERQPDNKFATQSENVFFNRPQPAV